MYKISKSEYKLTVRLPCWLSWATAAGNVVDTATGVAPTPGILISAPCGKIVCCGCWKDKSFVF